MSGKWISEYGNSIFSPYKPNQIDGSAYTLRIGSEVYVSPEKDAPGKSSISSLYSGEPIEIRSGQFAFLITKEYIQIPYNLMALINIKNGLKVQGLINVSGFHVDPGYDGKLIFAIFNAGPKTIILREGDDAFLIWLAQLEDPSKKYSRTKKGFSSISSDLTSNIPRESISLSSLNRKLESLQQDFRALRWIFGLFVSAFVSALIGIFAYYFKK